MEIIQTLLRKYSCALGVPNHIRGTLYLFKITALEGECQQKSTRVLAVTSSFSPRLSQTLTQTVKSYRKGL